MEWFPTVWVDVGSFQQGRLKNTANITSRMGQIVTLSAKGSTFGCGRLDEGFNSAPDVPAIKNSFSDCNIGEVILMPERTVPKKLHVWKKHEMKCRAQWNGWEDWFHYPEYWNICWRNKKKAVKDDHIALEPKSTSIEERELTIECKESVLEVGETNTESIRTYETSIPVFEVSAVTHFR